MINDESLNTARAFRLHKYKLARFPSVSCIVCLCVCYLGDDVEPEVGEVEERLLVVGLELRVRHQLVQVLVGDAVLGHYVERDDTHLVVVRHRLHNK